MDAITTARYMDQLNRRRDQIVLTLEYVGEEQKQVEENTDWLDQAAFQSRVDLLDRLSEWYRTEIDQIDQALDRIKKNRYGLCSACHNPIESSRLEISPEAEFCVGCQEFREELTTDG